MLVVVLLVERSKICQRPKISKNWLNLKKLNLIQAKANKASRTNFLTPKARIAFNN